MINGKVPQFARRERGKWRRAGAIAQTASNHHRMRRSHNLQASHLTMQIRRSEWGLEIDALLPVLLSGRFIPANVAETGYSNDCGESAGCEAMITWTEKNWLFSGVG